MSKKIYNSEAERKKAWRQANPERVRENYRRWCKAHPEKIAEYNRKQYLRLKALRNAEKERMKGEETDGR